MPFPSIFQKALPIVMTGLIFASDACSSTASPSYDDKFGIKVGFPFETDPMRGRDFREISIHPNSDALLFVECSRALEPTGGCYVLRYHLTDKTLQRYALPEGYFYTAASVSPRGTYVVMTRVPQHREAALASREAHEQSEVAVMHADGTGFRVLSLARGLKVGPIMSPDETRIAYWRATARPPKSKTFSSNFNVWEINLQTGEDRLFAGPFGFFDRSNMQYLSQDEILIGAGYPSAAGMNPFQYTKHYHWSEVYRMTRGMSAVPVPLLTDLEYASHPSKDDAGNLYFFVGSPQVAFVKQSVQGSIQRWPIPEAAANGVGTRELIASPNGSYLAFIYHVQGTRVGEAKKAIGVLDTSSSEWRHVTIPALQESTPIAITIEK